MKLIYNIALALFALKSKNPWIIALTSAILLLSSTLTIHGQQVDVLKTKCEEFSGSFAIDATDIKKYVSPDIKLSYTLDKVLIRLYVMSNCESVTLNGEDINYPSKDFGLAIVAVDTQRPFGPAKEAEIDGADYNMLVRYNYALWSWVSGTNAGKLLTALKKAKVSAVHAQTIEIERRGSLVEGRMVGIDKETVTWTENLSKPTYGSMNIGVQIDFFHGGQKMMDKCLWPLDKEGDFKLKSSETEFATIFGNQIEGSITGHTFMHDCTLTLGGTN